MGGFLKIARLEGLRHAWYIKSNTNAILNRAKTTEAGLMSRSITLSDIASTPHISAVMQAYRIPLV